MVLYGINWYVQNIWVSTTIYSNIIYENENEYHFSFIVLTLIIIQLELY